MVIDLAEALLHLFAGWLFLFSPSFRERTLARWQHESRMDVMQDIVGGAAGVLLSLLLPLFLWWELSGGA